MAGRISWAARLAPLALVAASCGSSESDAGGSSFTWEEFAARYAEIFCQGISPCCQAVGTPNDLAACQDHFALEFRVDAKLARHFDANRATECLSELEKAVATCAPEPAVCDQVFTGDAGPGEKCVVQLDCAQPAGGAAFCEATSLNGAPPAYICRTIVPAAEGQPCESPLTDPKSYECGEPGFYCDDAANICHAVKALGAPCASDVECGSDASCAGTCVAKAAIGASCTQTSDCVTEAHCSSGACAPDKAAGEACTSDDCTNGFCYSGKCMPSGLKCYAAK